MRWTSMVAVILAMLTVGRLPCRAQVAGGKPAVAGNAAPAASGAQSTPQARPSGAAGADSSVAPDTRTEKQKALARQTEKLFEMATELKVEVDKTNRNILSMKVVEEAERIELLAKGMKEQAKK